jgi:hypothetical protein
VAARHCLMRVAWCRAVIGPGTPPVPWHASGPSHGRSPRTSSLGMVQSAAGLESPDSAWYLAPFSHGASHASALLVLHRRPPSRRGPESRRGSVTQVTSVVSTTFGYSPCTEVFTSPGFCSSASSCSLLAGRRGGALLFGVSLGLASSAQLLVGCNFPGGVGRSGCRGGSGWATGGWAGVHKITLLAAEVIRLVDLAGEVGCLGPGRLDQCSAEMVLTGLSITRLDQLLVTDVHVDVGRAFFPAVRGCPVRRISASVRVAGPYSEVSCRRARVMLGRWHNRERLPMVTIGDRRGSLTKGRQLGTLCRTPTPGWVNCEG